MKPSTKVKVKTEYGEYIVDKDQYTRFSRNYDAMFEKIMTELPDETRIQNIIFGYNENLDGFTIQAYTHRCTLFGINEIFNEDHSNDREVVEKFLAAWSKLPEEESNKDQFEGIWKVTGKKIRFNRVWGDYYFNDEECLALLNGDHISFFSINKSGEEKTYVGILDEQEFNGFRFFGFKLDGYALPTEFQGHKLTENERTMLLAGKEVYLTNLWSAKKNKYYNAYCQYTIRNGLRITRFA